MPRSMTGIAGGQPEAPEGCTPAASGGRCELETAARSQLWWVARQAVSGPGQVPSHADTLRRWSRLLIDALLAFHSDLPDLPNPQARLWRLRLDQTIERRLKPVTGGLPARQWLVHAHHRTQSRPHPARDRQLYQSWIPYLVAVARDLIGETAAAARHTARTGDSATTTHLLQARHALQHACHHLKAR